MKKYVAKAKRLDYYDLGEGISLLNILTKTADGLLDRVDTYIGTEEDGFIRVGGTESGLSDSGVYFKYSDYVKMIDYNRKLYLQVYHDNLKAQYHI